MSSLCKLVADALSDVADEETLMVGLVRERLLEEEAVVLLSVALLERRRVNRVEKEAMEDRRRSEVRRESAEVGSVGTGGRAVLGDMMVAGQMRRMSISCWLSKAR